MNPRIIKSITLVCLLGMTNLADAQEFLASKSSTEAYLKVYTKLEEINDGGYLWVRGIPYTILRADGKRAQWVSNDSGEELVNLPPGHYKIVPEGTNRAQGMGATLEHGKLTVIHI